MHVDDLHDWDVSPAQARALQERLSAQVRIEPLPKCIRRVAGADLAVSREAGLFFAAVVVLTFPELETVEVVTARAPASFPYVPGLLTFREGPALADAFRKVAGAPDVVVFDGQGLAHPRRMGLACHMGLWLDVPTLGCAKSRLTGEYREPGPEKGRSSILRDRGERIGAVLRSRTGVRPLFVSPGHRADIPTSTDLVLACCTRYRLPEPTRRAHHEVALAKADYLTGRSR